MLLEEIKEKFASMKFESSREIDNIETNHRVYAIKFGNEYGVGISFTSDIEVNEEFSSVSFRTIELKDQGKLLYLSCENSDLRNYFASFCVSFIDEENIDEVVRDPLGWWQNWSQLLGNRKYDKKPYSLLSELIAVKSLYVDNKELVWGGPDFRSHDIELGEFDVEVKSTLLKSKTEITISSLYQFDFQKKLFLYFIRLEKAKEGLNINILVKDLIALGYDKNDLESKLMQMGYPSGSSAREINYTILEKRKYAVDSNFPRITLDSFKENHLFESITKITYDINLSNLEFTEW
jgi:hypothetical protein